MDRRTKKGQEMLVIDYIKNNGGFSIFWVTENQKRAHAAERLEKSGKIKVYPVGFPYYKAIVE